MRWAKHYGTNKLREHSVKALNELDLVLTTPMTVLSEYQRTTTYPSVLFNTSWRRTVVDEAHCIRNQKTLTSKAITAIRAARRWAVTGIPVQNRLSDFSSLLRFLRTYPYDTKEVFDSDIIGCWKVSETDEPTTRLKKLAQAIMLRRSKNRIHLPERHNLISWLQFQSAEARRYNRIEAAIARSLETDLEADQLPARSYTNALTGINILRRFCDVGLRACTNLDYSIKTLDTAKDQKWTASDAREAFENLTAFGTVSCDRCGLENRLGDDLTNLEGGVPRMTQCLKLFCSDCFTRSLQKTFCDHQPPCSVAGVSPGPQADLQCELKHEINSPLEEVPAKIQAITDELKTFQTEKR